MMKTLRYTLFICLTLVATLASAQIKRVSGTISDDFDVLPGVNVQEVDASGRTVSATVTDMNGNFVLQIKSQKNKLKVSYVGFKPQTLPINKTVFKIMMQDNTTAMKEVQVTAKKMMKTSGLAIPEREVSFAAQGINAKEFEGLGITSVDEALQGRIAGLDIVANSGDLGSGTTMRLRGASTLGLGTTKSDPLIVVNGNIWDVDASDFDPSTASEDQFAQLLNVNTEDIEDIKVLKDAAATAIWGSQGGNGVIEITTKRGKRGPATVDYTAKFTITNQPKGIDLLTGDQYTMMLKEAYFNPRQVTSAADINEISYRDYSVFPETYNYQQNTDWVDAVQQTGLRQNHYLVVSGGDDKATFRISGGYDHETGTIIKQALDRFSTRLALDYYVNDRITLSSNFSLTYTDNDKNYEDLLAIAYKKMPNLSIYRMTDPYTATDEYYYPLQEGQYTMGINYTTGDDLMKDQRTMDNPVAVANLATYSYKTYDITPELILNYKILGKDDSKHQLNYKGQVVMNINNAYSDRDFPRELTSANFLNTHSASTASNKSLGFTTRHTLTFTPHFNNEKHYLTAMGRFELNSGSSNSQSSSAYRLPTGITTPTAGLNSGMASDYNEWRGIYWTFSSHYAYDSRYMLDFSIRIDGTTKFGPDNRWGYFPAVSGRWNIIDEKFMKWFRDKAKMSMLSFRPGWGKVGNSPTANYLYMNTYNTIGSTYLGTVSASMNGLKLTNLRWEDIYTWNFGFDLGFFDDRLKATFEIYTKTTKNMLMPTVGIPTSNGYSSLAYMNVGDMKNTGWEFNITGDRIVKKGKFSLDFNIAFANNRNVITDMDATVLETLNTDLVESNRSLLQRVQIDNPFGSIYGFKYKGVYQYNYSTAEKLSQTQSEEAKNLGYKNDLEYNVSLGKTYPVATNADGSIKYKINGNTGKETPIQQTCFYKTTNSTNYGFNGGDAIYEDINHDGTINQLDVVYLGNSLPKLTGGFGFKLHYDRFSLNAQFNYRIDYDIYNLARLDMEAMTSNNNQSQAVNYRWRKEGDGYSEACLPRALIGGTNYNTMVSDRFIEDGTFLRLNYLQLSYNFDPKLIKRIGLKKLSVYVSANNLFCITGYTGVDPEISYGGLGVTTDSSKTPKSKSYTMGLTVGF